MPEQFVLPDGTVGDKGFCRTCGVEIVWIRTKNNKSAPTNLDGVSHWATCADAEAWRARVAARKATS